MVDIPGVMASSEYYPYVYYKISIDLCWT